MSIHTAAKRLVLAATTLLAVSDAAAQQRLPRTGGDTTIKGATIEIIQTYKPEVQQAPKPEMTPVLPPADTSRPTFAYEVPQQTLYYTYSSLPLRPLALGKDSLGLPFQNYIKLGGGNLNTLFLDLGIGSLRGRNYAATIHGHHLSQRGNIENQRTAGTGLEAQGLLRGNNNTWEGFVNASRSSYGYFGYDHDVYNPPTDSLSQVFTGVRGGVSVKNDMPLGLGFYYNPSVNVGIYTDAFNASERSLNFALPMSYDVDTSIRLSFGINGRFNQLQTDSLTQSSNILQLTPAVNIHTGGLQLRIGAYPTFGAGGNTHLLPDLALRLRPAQASQFAFVAGWQARLLQNSYEQLSTVNPYMYNTYNMQQTRTDEVYAGIEGNVGQHVSFNGKVSWWQYNHLPMYLNDTNTDGRQFTVLYAPRVNAIGIQMGIKYQVANVFSLAFRADVYNFYNSTYQRVYHQPGVLLRADMGLRPTKALTLNVYLCYIDGIYAIDRNSWQRKLDAGIDVGAGAEYAFIPRLAAFIQVNNILNNRYERWLGYQTYGINVYGGLRLKF